MGLREITGFVAQGLLGACWVWAMSARTPQLRRRTRHRALRTRVLLLKASAVVLTLAVVVVIQFWTTELWHVAVALVGAVVLGAVLRRTHRRLVAAPSHRLTLGQRA